MWRHSLLAALLLVAILPTSISARPVVGQNKKRSKVVASVKAVLDAQAKMLTPVMNSLMGFLGTVVTGLFGSLVAGAFLRAK